VTMPLVDHADKAGPVSVAAAAAAAAALHALATSASCYAVIPPHLCLCICQYSSSYMLTTHTLHLQRVTYALLHILTRWCMSAGVIAGC